MSSKSRQPPWYAPALALSVGSGSVVFLIRLESVIRNYEWGAPTGAEGAGAFGIYQACSGLPVYHDFTRISVGFIFNFAFYYVYGVILRLFPSCTDTVPIIGRFITVTILLAFGLLLLKHCGRKLGLLERLAIVGLLMSPIVGWSAFALRPDVGGMVALGGSVLAFLEYLRWTSPGALVVSGVALLVAWGFKQPFLVVAPVMVGVLLVRREVGKAGVFVLTLSLGVVASVALNPASYLTHTVVLPSQHPILAEIGLLNLGSFIVKSVGLLAPLFLAAGLLPREKLRTQENAFLGAGFLWCCVVMGALAGKDGASETYYFPAVVIGLLFLLRNVHRLGLNRRLVVMLALATATVASNGVLLTGIRGRVRLDGSNRAEILELRRALARASDPKLVWGDISARPWVSGNVEIRIFDPFIDLAQAEDVSGSIRVRDLVRDGHFATIAVPDEGAAVLDLSRYELQRRIGSTSVFVKK